MDFQERMDSYDEEHCWQYSIRLKNKQEDLMILAHRLGVRENLIEKYTQLLTIDDFEFKHITNEEDPNVELTPAEIVKNQAEKDAAKAFIERHEWLGKLTIYTSDWFVAYHRGVLAGVVLMGMPNAFSKLLGDNIECLEYLIKEWKLDVDVVSTKKIERLINRGACISWSPKGLASALIMWAIRWMVKNTRFRLFTAYSDPMAREIGTIYQACNFYYLGQKAGGTKKYKGKSGNMVSDRSFRTRSAYKRYAKKLGIKWDERWSKTMGLNWNLIPEDVQAVLKEASKKALKEAEVVTFPSKGKYAYVLGKNKIETKILRKIFQENNKILPYPKRDSDEPE